jgi:hypothetical protein
LSESNAKTYFYKLDDIPFALLTEGKYTVMRKFINEFDSGVDFLSFRIFEKY